MTRPVQTSKRLSTLAACFALLVLVPVSAFATPRLEFDIGSGGTISYAGGTNPLQGANIDVTRIRATNGAPSNNNLWRNIVDGALTFTTGNFAGPGPLGIGWMFGGGGTVSLTGSVDLNGGGIGAGDIVNSVLFTGTFRASPIDNAAALVLPLVYGLSVSVALFGTTIPAALTDYWGLTQLPNNEWTGQFVLGGVGGYTGAGGFSSGVAWGTGSLEAVAPEPAAWVLFGTALATIAGLVRRRRRLST